MDLKSDLVDLQKRIAKAHATIQPAKITDEIKNLETEMSNPDFWSHQARAKDFSQKLSELKNLQEAWANLEKDCHELVELCDIISEEHEPQARADVIKNFNLLKEKLRSAELKLFLNGEYDHNNAIMSVYVGAGGVDAQDWAEMLLRMYLRYTESKNFKTELLEKSLGDQAGLKSATVKISGSYAYGYLKEEAGVHRLVRLSPFNTGQTRETSFAMIEVIPEIKDDQEFEIKEEDLRIDVYAASGPGGQNVNKSNSAVRVTHLPTKLAAACQNERSQLQNKQTALKVLKGKLLKLKEKERAETIDQLKGDHGQASWGHQIRSYVLHPYQMVKDHRTDFETSQINKMLDGELLDQFIEASLEKRAKG